MAIPKPLPFNSYQELSHATAVYPPELGLEYLTLGLVGEAGELANKVKKVLRGDLNRAAIEEGIKHELGDILWYLSELCSEMGLSFEEVARGNILMLQRRQREGTIKGSGDHR